MDSSGLIDVRPGVRSGKPCLVGTRIAVYDVLDYLASGMTHDEIVADFPELTEGLHAGWARAAGFDISVRSVRRARCGQTASASPQLQTAVIDSPR